MMRLLYAFAAAALIAPPDTAIWHYDEPVSVNETGGSEKTVMMQAGMMSENEMGDFREVSSSSSQYSCFSLSSGL